MDIYCFGNEFVPEDKKAKLLADTLKVEGVNFIKCDYPEQLLDKILAGEHIVILDVVKGIKDTRIFKSIEEFEEMRPGSVHDVDLSFFLHILSKAELMKPDNLTIIGVSP